MSVEVLVLSLYDLVLNVHSTVLPAKSDSDFMFCLQRYQGLIIDRWLVYTIVRIGLI